MFRFRVVVVCVVFAAWGIAVGAVAGDTPRKTADELVFQPHEMPPFDLPAMFRAPPVTSPPMRVRSGGYTSVQVNVNALGDNIVGDAANEPTLAVDPTNPDRMVICWRQFDTIVSNFRQAGYAYSHDGGLTWNAGVLDPGVFRSDPVLDVDSSGNFYFYSLKEDFNCDMFISSDGGVTWTAPIPAWGGDKNWLKIDRSGGVGDGNVYITWSGHNNFSRSTDGGLTYSTPVAVPDDPRWGTMEVGPDGALYIAGADQYSFDFSRSGNAEDPAQTPSFELSRNVNLGGDLPNYTGPNPKGLLGQPWIASDHSGGTYHGNVYILGTVSPDLNTDPADVMFIRSTDSGENWSAPVRVNDDSLDSREWQWFGTLSVAPSGRLDVVWFDTRHLMAVNWSELYYSYSVDAGSTWSGNMSVSVPFDSHVGWPDQEKIGDYIHMSSLTSHARLAYAATFNGEQDVYYVELGDCNGNGVHDAEDVANGTVADINQNLVPDDCEPDCNGNGYPDSFEIELGLSADCNLNGAPDDCDIAEGVSTDCNGNGIPDECDTAAGTSGDCNANSIPDECEFAVSDCNANGCPDEWDIAGGDSEDCNGNGIPDECDIADEASADCNANAVPDECDIALGASSDCNVNGVPDECEFAVSDCNANGCPDEWDIDQGIADDCNANGVPDECDAAPVFSTPRAITTDARSASCVFSADLDGDGDADVLSASSGDFKIAWYENTDGLGTFGPQQVITTAADAASSVFATDLDGDGDADVLSASFDDDKVAWYENTDGLGTFGVQQVITTSADGANSVFAEDLDGDGDADVLSASWSDNKIAWYENVDGLGTFGPQQIISATAIGANTVFAADLDGDGDADVISASNRDDTIAWYENTDGLGTFGPQQVITTATNFPSCVFAADLDGDGDVDVLSASVSDFKIAWYENVDGLGTFGPQQIISGSAIGASSVFAADLDGDGDADVLSTAHDVNRVSWYENTDGLGTFGVRRDIATDARGAESVFAVDVDGDADADVLSALYHSHTIAWYENTNDDCNGNHVPDECDIAEGTSQDCNGNGVPDGCDIRRGTSGDDNSNGVPDECEVTQVGDLNCDGAVDLFDIEPFALALSNPAGYGTAYPDCNRMLADVNGDGSADLFDIDPFVLLLTGG